MTYKSSSGQRFWSLGLAKPAYWAGPEALLITPDGVYLVDRKDLTIEVPFATYLLTQTIEHAKSEGRKID